MIGVTVTWAPTDTVSLVDLTPEKSGARSSSSSSSSFRERDLEVVPVRPGEAEGGESREEDQSRLHLDLPVVATLLLLRLRTGVFYSNFCQFASKHYFSHGCFNLSASPE